MFFLEKTTTTTWNWFHNGDKVINFYALFIESIKVLYIWKCTNLLWLFPNCLPHYLMVICLFCIYSLKKLYFAIQLLSIKDTWRPVSGPAPLEILWGFTITLHHLSPFTIISVSPRWKLYHPTEHLRVV